MNHSWCVCTLWAIISNFQKAVISTNIDFGLICLYLVLPSHILNKLTVDKKKEKKKKEQLPWWKAKSAKPFFPSLLSSSLPGPCGIKQSRVGFLHCSTWLDPRWLRAAAGACGSCSRSYPHPHSHPHPHPHAGGAALGRVSRTGVCAREWGELRGPWFARRERDVPSPSHPKTGIML